MSIPKWDPANLLQISYEIDYPDAPVFCIGESAKPGHPRCRWTIPEPDCTSIRNLLRILRDFEPQSVSVQDLRQIASLCLCDGYHKSQLGEVVDRWTRVVRLAAQQRSRLAGSSTTPNGDKQLQQYLAEAETRKKELQQALEKCEKLNDSVHSLNKLLEESKRREYGLSSTVSSMKVQADKLEGEKVKIRKELILATERARGLETRSFGLEEQKCALTEELDQLRHELLVAKQGAQRLEVKCAQMSEEMDALKTESAGLNEKNCTILNAIKQMEAERDSAIDSQKEATVELTDMKNSNRALRDEVHSLLLVVDSLQGSIATCWLHKLRSWLTWFSFSAK